MDETMDEMTVEEFAIKLLQLKECLRKKTVKIRMSNGIIANPKMRFVPKEEGRMELTDEAVDFAVISY